LKSEATEFEGHTGIQCRFKTNAAKAKFDRSTAVAIFRIVQAALTIVARHAHASPVLIAFPMRKNGMILTVTGKRRGITRKLITGHDSLGLTGRRERSLALGGGFTLAGSINKGTILTVKIPLSRVMIGTAL
jgi:signal transduction histidine kinase